jgi:hypothetical protein
MRRPNSRGGSYGWNSIQTAMALVVPPARAPKPMVSSTRIRSSLKESSRRSVAAAGVQVYFRGVRPGNPPRPTAPPLVPSIHGGAVQLYTKILIGLIAGIAAGAIANFADLTWMQEVLQRLEPIGTVFIRLIMMIVIPLVVASLILGTASLGDLRKLGRLGGKTVAFYLVTTAIAVSIGLLVSNVVKPGRASIRPRGMPLPPRSRVTPQAGSAGRGCAERGARHC